MKRLLGVLTIVIITLVGAGGRETAAAKQTLTGQEALNFLHETGIYDQLLTPEASGGFPPHGREFFAAGLIGADDGDTDDLFGISVARNGDTVLIGVNQADIGGNIDQGAAYVFTAVGSTGWAQEAKLTADDGAADDLFGYAVTLEGDTAVIGAYQADIDGNGNQGAAYVFDRSGVNWSQTKKLTVASGSAGDEFGFAVALNGGKALVGAPLDDIDGNIDQGAAYLFTQNGSSWSQTAVLTAEFGAAGDEFGIAVALDGSTALVGAPMEDIGFDENQGAAYVFVGFGSSWSQEDRLATGDGAEDDEFGGAVALDGDTALVGAHLADVNGIANQGAAYVFTRSEVSWNQQGKLTADDGAQGDRLGRSVAVEGDTALSGAPRANINGNGDQGAAYVFIREGNSWSQQSKLADWNHGEGGDRFGRSVTLDGDTAVVGAINAQPPSGNTDRGAIYTFARSPIPWLLDGQALASDGAEDDLFGYAVALDGETALVGASSVKIGNNVAQGAAYIFERSVNTWVQIAKLTSSTGSEGDWFGYSVALDGDTALVGALRADVNGNASQGAAYIFSRTGNSWIEQAALTATDGAALDNFGGAVALAGNTALVGALQADVNGNNKQGAAYVFTGAGNNWSQQTKLTAADGAEEDKFGISVALDGNTALVGASGVNFFGSEDHGAAYVFIRAGDSWSQQTKLTAAGGAANDLFGFAVALDGDTALVGARLADINGNFNQGAAYIFTRTGSSWSQQAKLTAADGAGGDAFGVSVALDGNTALVGATGANVNGNSQQGAAYIFTNRGTEGWVQQTRLSANDDTEGDNDDFGFAVALKGNFALVGAMEFFESAPGKAYFFRRQPYENFLPLVVR